mmetsp:Transcript_56122/g.114756  ORF Transcript_56122/g.114756 Transcript_56122/m.114756 type:complete len:263 (+) Transcript_56122:69-857(+)
MEPRPIPSNSKFVQLLISLEQAEQGGIYQFPDFPFKDIAQLSCKIHNNPQLGDSRERDHLQTSLSVFFSDTLRFPNSENILEEIKEIGRHYDRNERYFNSTWDAVRVQLQEPEEFRDFEWYIETAVHVNCLHNFQVRAINDQKLIQYGFDIIKSAHRYCELVAQGPWPELIAHDLNLVYDILANLTFKVEDDDLYIPPPEEFPDKPDRFDRARAHRQFKLRGVLKLTLAKLDFQVEQGIPNVHALVTALPTELEGVSLLRSN